MTADHQNFMTALLYADTIIPAMKDLICGHSLLPEPFRAPLLMLPRLGVGLGIALGFGVPKITGFDAYFAQVKSSGAPVPIFLAVALIAVEIIAGLALAAGLGTRAAGGTLALAMAGILLLPTQAPFPWDAAAFMLGGYFFVVTGAGAWSIDALLTAPRGAHSS